MKLTTQNLYTLGLILTYSEGKIRIYSGSDEVVHAAAISGAHGAIGTGYNYWCKAVRQAWNAVLGGDVAFAHRFASVFQRNIDTLIRSGSFYRFCRVAVKLRHDVDIGPGRAPHSAVGKSWSNEQVSQILAAVDDAAGV